MPNFVHGRNTKVFIAGYDLTSYFNQASISGQADVAEVTAFQDTAKSYVGGMKDATLALDGMHDPSTGAVDQVLAAALAVDATIFTYLPEGDTAGKSGYSMTADETAYSVSSPINDAVKVSAAAQSTVGMERVVSIAALSSRTGTAALAGVDGTTGSSNAGVAGYLHIGAVSGTATAAPRVQASDDDVTYADAVVFTGSGTLTSFANTAQRVAAAGTVGRYVRALWNIGAGGTVTYWMGFAANGEL